jgi:hypothetical protein
VTWLATRPAAWRGADQRFARRGPTVRLGVTGVRVCQEARPLGGKCRPPGKAPTGQKAARQDAKEAFRLLEPGAVFGGEMPHGPVRRIPQQRSALCLPGQRLGLTGPLAPPGPQAADFQAPGGVERVHEPIGALPPREALGDVLERGAEGRALPGGPDGPSDRPGGHGQRVDPHAGPVADVRRHASCTVAGRGRCGWGGALAPVPASVFSAAAPHAALVIRPQRVAVELAPVVGLRRAWLVVALEPIRPLVRLQIDRLEDAPHGRAAEAIGSHGVQHGRHALLSRPTCDRAPLVVRHLAGHGAERHAGARGNGARSPRAGGIVPARQAERVVPPSPRAHGVVGAGEVTADLSGIGGVHIRRPQANPSASCERWWCGMGARASLQGRLEVLR